MSMVKVVRMFVFWLRRYLLLCVAILALLAIETFLANIANGLLIRTSEFRNGTQYIPECDCKRPLFYGKTDQRLNSSCSDEGTFHVSDQKVVSYSFFLYATCDENDAACQAERWRRKKTFEPGLPLNLQLVRKYYPGYTVRIYTNETLTPNYCPFVCKNSDIFWCDISQTPSHGDRSRLYPTLWRFLPLGDPTVSVFLSRDLDSLITAREAAAVNEWLEMDQAIHVMRDDKLFHTAPIIGGLWGVRNDLLEEPPASEVRQEILEKTRYSIGGQWFDRAVLQKLIFEKRQEDIIAHDSYHCEYWSQFTAVLPFPTQRNNSLNDCVGCQGFDGKSYYNISKCPLECRPIDGKHWEYC